MPGDSPDENEASSGLQNSSADFPEKINFDQFPFHNILSMPDVNMPENTIQDFAEIYRHQTVYPMIYQPGAYTLRPKTKEKKCRTNYRVPENAAKLNAAIDALIEQMHDSKEYPKDMKAAAKVFQIPYNTLRDNFIR